MIKIKLTIYGKEYEVSISAKDCNNLNRSTKATNTVKQWLETRLWEASRDNTNDSPMYNEITANAHKLHNYGKKQN